MRSEEPAAGPFERLRLGFGYLVALAVPPWLLLAAAVVQLQPEWRELPFLPRTIVGLVSAGVLLLLFASLAGATALFVRGSMRLLRGTADAQAERRWRGVVGDGATLKPDAWDEETERIPRRPGDAEREDTGGSTAP